MAVSEVSENAYYWCRLAYIRGEFQKLYGLGCPVVCTVFPTNVVTMKIGRHGSDFHGLRALLAEPGLPHPTPYSRAQLVQRIFSKDSFFSPGNALKVSTASGQRESMCG